MVSLGALCASSLACWRWSARLLAGPAAPGALLRHVAVKLHQVGDLCCTDVASCCVMSKNPSVNPFRALPFPSGTPTATDKFKIPLRAVFRFLPDAQTFLPV